MPIAAKIISKMPQEYTFSSYDENIHRDYVTRVVEISIYVIISLLFINGELYSNSNWFWAIIGAAFLYEFMPLLSERFRSITHRLPTSVFNYSLFALLIIFYIPVGNSLVLIGFLLVAMSSYWLSWLGLITSFFAITTAYALAPLYQLSSVNYDDLANLILRVFVMGALGATIVGYSKQDQKERRKLVDFSNEASLERNRIVSLINSMADAVVATDQDGKIQLYNGAALILFNTNETLTGKNLQEYLKLKDKETKKAYNIIAEAQKTGRIIQRDDVLYKNNLKETLNIFVNLAPVRVSVTEEGQTGYIILLRDITKEKTIEEQRDEFISIVSHELRTPIAITEANISTALLPSVKTLKQKNDFLEQAHKNIVFLASLVNDITLLAHAEQGRLDTTLTKENTSTVIEELHSNYETQAKDAGLKLKIKIAKSTPDIMTNTERLKEILQDFITNAIKYTDKGTVTIEAAPKGRKYVRLGIRDTGIGISSSDLKKVFEKFYRSEDFRTREHSGTGLGLYIAHKLAALISAKIGAESEIDKGSFFYIDVPVAKD